MPLDDKNGALIRRLDNALLFGTTGRDALPKLLQDCKSALESIPSSTAIVPPSWVAFSKAAGETSEGVMRRALGDIASISPLSTAAPQEIARNALIAAEALATPVSAIERSEDTKRLDWLEENHFHDATTPRSDVWRFYSPLDGSTWKPLREKIDAQIAASAPNAPHDIGGSRG